MLILISSLKLSTVPYAAGPESRGQHGYISMSNCFPSLIVRWILNFVDQPTHENHENWYPTNKSDFTVIEMVTKAGLTVWINRIDLCNVDLFIYRNFIKDNIETIKNKYYRQAVEGVEHGYKYTYSVPFHTDTGKHNLYLFNIVYPFFFWGDFPLFSHNKNLNTLYWHFSDLNIYIFMYWINTDITCYFFWNDQNTNFLVDGYFYFPLFSGKRSILIFCVYFLLT
jgi:hypothetical protein